MDRIQQAIEKARALREARATGGALPVQDVPEQDWRPAEHTPAPDPLDTEDPLRLGAPLVVAPAPAEDASDSPGRRAAPEPTRGSPLSGPHSAPRAPRFHIAKPELVWQKLTPFKPDRKQMHRNRIVTYDRTEEAHISYDIMRTRLLRALRKNNWTSVAITSPTANCGKTTTSINLAFSLAHQKDTRTVLMDIDLRCPQMANMLGLKESHSMAALLDGSGEIARNFVRYGDTLAIGTNELPSRYPAELLQNKAAAKALERMRGELKPDVIIYDIPPMSGNDDVIAFLPHVDCVLLVAAAESTTIDDVDRCERELGAQTNVLGVILNKCRYLPEQDTYY